MKPAFAEIFDDFMSLIYPRYCLACENGLVKGEETICTRCIHDLPRTDYHLHRSNPVFNRLDGRIPLQYAMSFLLFRKKGIVQHLLHQLKYNNHPEVGVMLGRVYGERLRQENFQDQFNGIVPIPLHSSKMRTRGYNQSEEFAKGLSQSLEVPVLPKVIERATKTETQTKKDKLGRWENVSEVFRVNDPQAITSKHILLVDDVITTGATIEACSQILLQSGCGLLSVASIAYAHA